MHPVETLEEALTALEAYYHYVKIEDFDRAGTVIIKPRKNHNLYKQSIDEMLVCSFPRLCVLSKIINLINNLVYKIDDYVRRDI